MKNSYLRSPLVELAIVVSLVNLCFLNVWRELHFASPADAYWIPTFTRASHLAIIVLCASISAVLWLLGRYVRATGNRILDYLARLTLVLSLVVPGNYLRLVLGIDSEALYWIKDHRTIAGALAVVVGGGLVYGLIWHMRYISRAVAVVLLVFSPFAVLTLSQAVWRGATSGDAEAAVADLESEAPQGRGVAQQRVVWLIFDELDLRIAFTGRPRGLALPAFDRLRAQSVFSEEARSHSRSTSKAIPSYIVGDLVKEVERRGPADLGLRLDTDPPGHYTEWTEFETFFAAADAMGARTAIVGLYHPYCRIFRSYYDYCDWYAIKTFTAQATDELVTEMRSQLAGVTPFFRRINGIRTYRGMMEDAPRVAADARYDAVYIHASVPHGPDIYDEETGGVTWFNTSKAGYFGNLILADRMLGRIRETMEVAGVWDSTAVVVTSDHEWRHVRLYDNVRVRKVPFLVKMPGQAREVPHRAEFSPLVVSKDVILDIVAGRLRDAGEVVARLVDPGGDS